MIKSKLFSAIVALAIGMFSVSSYAVEATIDWTNATQREDGSALQPGELRETQIDYGKCVNNNEFPPTRAGMVSFASPLTTGKIPELSYGKWCFRARHIDSTGVASSDTGSVWAMYLAPPKPPTLLTVRGIVWEMKTNPVDGPYLSRVVGAVGAGKKCHGLAPQMGFDLFVVDRKDVKLNKGMKPKGTLVAQCEIA